jgi:hypothetical protein
MLSFADEQIHDFLVGLVTLAIAGWLLYLLLRYLRRTRVGLAIGVPIAVAFGLRALAAIVVTTTGAGESLRGGDENYFLLQAGLFEHAPFLSSDWTDALTKHLYEFVFAVQLRVFDSPELVLRFTQAAIAVAGLILLATAVYQLAGPRAGVIAAWLLALEPSNVFFSTLLHKEPNLLLAGGLVAFGGACMWKTARLQYLWPIALGCLVAVATRPYAGWFLIAAGAAITLHTGLRSRTEGGARSLTFVALVVMLAAISAPTILKASTHESLKKNLQVSQSANANDASNLSLEEVDFSTRGAIIVNLPQRIADVMTRPYPWQIGNTSQQLGLLGTLFAFTCLFLLARELLRARGHIMDRAGPFVYLALFTLIGYSLSAGNAGTAFRYRMHVVALVVCLLVVLRELRLHPAPAPQPDEVVTREPAVATPSLAGA